MIGCGDEDVGTAVGAAVRAGAAAGAAALDFFCLSSASGTGSVVGTEEGAGAGAEAEAGVLDFLCL